MAKPQSPPSQVFENAAEQALARLAELPPITPPEPPELPDHPGFPDTSVALPVEAQVPDTVQLPEWLV